MTTTYEPEQTRYVVVFGTGPADLRETQATIAETVGGTTAEAAVRFAAEQLGKSTLRFFLENPSADPRLSLGEHDFADANGWIITGYTVERYNDVTGTDEDWCLNGGLK